MDLKTLIKANIRYKKGSFKSIIILMFIISLSVTTIVSLKRNFPESIRNAYDRQEVGNITLNIQKAFLTEEMIEDLREHSLVKKVDVIDAIAPDNYKFENGRGGSFNIRVMEMNDSVDRLWNSDLSDYEEEVPTLSPGEVYIPRALAEQDRAEVGDQLTIEFKGASYTFTVKGLVEEPVCGSVYISLKTPFICSEDFQRIVEDRSEAIRKDPSIVSDLYEIVYITKADDCELTDNRFAATLSKENAIGSFAHGLLTRTDSLHYQGIMPDIILNVFAVFVIILSVIVFVVMSNSISSSIEMNYTDLGILKAMGYNSGRLRLIFLGQYMLAEVIGTVLGAFAAIPVIIYLPRAFESSVCLKIFGGVNVLPTVLILLGILLLSAVFILIISGKVGHISPIRAVSGGRSEIYFDSRIRIPVTGKLLSARLAFRQFTSGKRRYIASIAIASILVFFLMTMTGMTDAVSSENAQRAMGGTSENLEVYIDFDEYSPENTEYVRTQIKKAEEIIREYTDINERYFFNDKYFLLDGEQICCRLSEDEETFTVTEGRAPQYDNEIVVGQIYAEDMGYQIGDKLPVSYRGKTRDFIISGYAVAVINTGRFIGMNGDGARTLIDDFIPHNAGFKLADKSKTGEICERLETELPEDCEVFKVASADEEDDSILTKTAMAIKAVIYVISAVFALVVVSMMCSKTFVREKIDIGIYKAMGFTSGNLRMQFAVRFLIVAFFGILIGTTMSLTISEKMLSFMLRSMGIVRFVIDYRFLTVFLPIIAVSLSYFVFAYLVAGKTKKVEVRNLITE